MNCFALLKRIKSVYASRYVYYGDDGSVSAGPDLPVTPTKCITYL